MSAQLNIDTDALAPKPGVWKVGDKEYRIKPAKLRHVAAVMKIQEAFSPLQRFSPDADAEAAMADLTDEELDKIKAADKNFDEMVLELVEGMDEETLDEVGFEDRITGIGIIAQSMQPADSKGLERIGATPSKKKTSQSGSPKS